MKNNLPNTCILFILFSISLSACNFIGANVEKKLTEHSLTLVRIEKPDSIGEITINNDGTYLKKPDTPFKLPTESSFIHFYNDGVFISFDNNQYSTGKWFYSTADSIITIRGNVKKETLLKLVSIQKDNFKFKILEVNKIKSNDDYLLFYSQSTHFEGQTKDLLSLNENQWRIKPIQKESNEQIKQRVLSQLKYHIDYFNMTKDKKQTYFETKILQSPFNFYQNALGVPHNYELPEEWVETFYSREDAEKAADLLRSTIKNIDGVKTHERFTETYTEIINKMIDRLLI
ncbi:hypothetical protein C3K47_16530 [Solitalea longa]|uniref:Lipoprotein n=1 Tax=Solitalea longa TaxID=2079460 RepID=A0A2S4ZXY8_9SPHI|nr:hypothetical protein [Solitalea longa]POY35185.1 hypothetical protein C3K47_16530 [Solitalea longa]